MVKYIVAFFGLFSFTSAVCETIHSGQTLSDLSLTYDGTLRYDIVVPAGATDLVITTSGGSGDADLYVQPHVAPSFSSFDCRPYLTGNAETCQYSHPETTTYHILIHAYESFTNLSLSASYSADQGSSGGTWSGFSQYYADAIGLSGWQLQEALQEAAARHHSRMSYSAVWDALKYTDEDPNNSNNVILLYTGRSQAKSFNSSGNSDPDAWNREHSWPKSHGFPSSGDWAYTDIHHLRPADASVNATRGSKDFDHGGSAISEAPGNYTDADSFEPHSAVKGDVARMMFYMDIRYNGGDATGTDDLTLVDYTGTSGAILGRICTLLEWHQQDPVDATELRRHDRIVERQGNRNPFVDYPSWADEIWSSGCQ